MEGKGLGFNLVPEGFDLRRETSVPTGLSETCLTPRGVCEEPYILVVRTTTR